MSAETRPILGRYVGRDNRPLADTIGRYVGRHSADISADMLRSTVGGVSVDCRWCIDRPSVVSGVLLTVVLLKYQPSPYPQGARKKSLSPMLVY